MLEILNIRKEFAGQTVLANLNLRIEDGEFFSLLGPSGCGKTTLLRILAGLEQPTGGEIRLNGQRVDHLPPQQRPFNMVFQKYALFPHLTVRENVAFGLRLKSVPENEVRDRCEKVLDMVGLRGFSARKPETLSGGQCQRVAVARALVNEPKVLLLDEPLSALDQKMREHMQTELRALQKRLKLTFIYVTHDQDEALILSDRIGVMNGGCLEQVNSPREIYDQPRTLFTAQFVGQMSRLQGRLVEVKDGLALIKLADDTRIVGRPNGGVGSLREGMTMEALIRPEKIQVLPAEQKSNGTSNSLIGRLSQRVFKGDQTEIHVEGGAGPLKAVLSGPSDELVEGGPIQVCFRPEDTVLFGESGE